MNTVSLRLSGNICGSVGYKLVFPALEKMGEEEKQSILITHTNYLWWWWANLELHFDCGSNEGCTNNHFHMSSGNNIINWS